MMDSLLPILLAIIIWMVSVFILRYTFKDTRLKQFKTADSDPMLFPSMLAFCGFIFSSACLWELITE